MVRKEAGTERKLGPSEKLKVCVAFAFAKFNGWARERAKAKVSGGKGGPQPLGSVARASVFKALERWSRPPLWRLESAPWVLTGTKGDAGLHMGMIKMDTKVKVIPNPFREENDVSSAPTPGAGLASGPGLGSAGGIVDSITATAVTGGSGGRDRSMDDIWTINMIGKESVTTYYSTLSTLYTLSTYSNNSPLNSYLTPPPSSAMSPPLSSILPATRPRDLPACFYRYVEPFPTTPIQPYCCPRWRPIS